MYNLKQQATVAADIARVICPDILFFMNFFEYSSKSIGIWAAILVSFFSGLNSEISLIPLFPDKRFSQLSFIFNPNDDIMFNEIMEHKQVRWDIRKEYRCEKCEPIWL